MLIEEGIRNQQSAISNSSERAAKILEPIQAFFDHVDAGGVAEADGAIVSKRRTWHDRDVRLAQQTIGEILRAEPELADVNQDIKRALRFHRGDVRDLGDPVK